MTTKLHPSIKSVAFTRTNDRAVRFLTDLIDSQCADDVKDAFEAALRERAKWAALHDNPDHVLYSRLADVLKSIPNLGV